MKKPILFAALAALFFCNVNAQTILTGVPLLDTNTVFKVEQVSILGIDGNSSPQKLIYHFVHPNGAIQSVNGPMLSGGKDPAILPAFGSLDLTEPIHPASNTVQWYCPERVSTSSNFLANPLSDTQSFSGSNIIASKGNIMGYDKFFDLRKTLTPSSPWYQLPAKEAPEKAPEKAEPTYIDHYRVARVQVGLSGKIPSINLFDYTLRPVDERRTGPFGTAYKLRVEANKEGAKTAFGDDPTISYKVSMMDGEFPQVQDPLSGNCTVFGGIEYKKNKEKDNSEFYEFMMLTFNNEGGLVNRVTHNSEVPLTIEEIYPFYGQYIAPQVQEVTHCIYIARGTGNKNTPNINRKIRRIFVADIKTGEIIKEDELELKYGTTTLMKTRRLKDNKLELYYLYPVKNKRGLVVITVGFNGIEKVHEIDNESPNFQAINLPEVPYTSLNARTVQTFDAADGGVVTVEQLYVTVDNGARNATQAYTFMKYDKDGNFVDLYGIGNLIGGANRELISLKDDKLSMLVYTRGVNNSTTLKLIDLDLSEFSVQTAILPEGEYLINDKASLYDASAGVVYFLTQQRLGKGLSLYWHKL